MAEYQNYAEAVEDEDFKEFVKQNWNRDIKDVREWELAAMFYKFKSRNGTLNEQDKDFLQKVENSAAQEDLDKLTDVHFPDKKYADLAQEDKAFIAVENKETKERNVALEDIKQFLDAQNLSANIENTTRSDAA